MRQIYVLLVFISCISYSQVSTTQEEYNYLTKGYKIQITSGLDMKSGYEFETFLIQKADSYEFEFKHLIKTKENSKVAIFVIAKSKVSGSTYYYCIPKNNTDLMNNFYSSLMELDERMTTAFAVATSLALSKAYN
jgi:hypothetical protein